MLPTITLQGGSINIDRQSRSKAWLDFSQQLVQDSVQSLLPMINERGQILGWLPIPSTTYTAGAGANLSQNPVKRAEYVQQIEGQSYPVAVVTLPDLATTDRPGTTGTLHNVNTFDADAHDSYRDRYVPDTFGNSAERKRLQQYVALVLNETEDRLWNADPSSIRAYKSNAYQPAKVNASKPVARIMGHSFATLIPTTTNNVLGYQSMWSAPVMYIIQRFNRGPYLNAMIHNMDPTMPAKPSPTPPPVTPAQINWMGELNPELGFGCEFIDLNWIQLFQTSPYVGTLNQPDQIVPVSITVTTAPAPFMAKVMQSAGPITYPGGATAFDTIRIIEQEKAAAGSYVFDFTIQYAYASASTDAQSVVAQLTLVVVDPA